MRRNVASNSPYEPVIAFSRAVRAGNHVFVSGTAAWGDDGRLVSGGVYEQAKQCIANIGAALEKAGTSLNDVVRTRTYMVDINHWEDVARAHREAFAAILPASTLVEVSRLASADMLVEIEADAVVGA
jgi:enamine deaminase RidA (YjgF/YER057c/UK114 family)